MENFSLVSSHNLLENPLLFPTEITNLLFVIKTRQPLKQNFMLNCKKTMIKKKEFKLITILFSFEDQLQFNKKIPLFWRFSFQIKTTDFWTLPLFPSRI